MTECQLIAAKLGAVMMIRMMMMMRLRLRLAISICHGATRTIAHKSAKEIIDCTIVIIIGVAKPPRERRKRKENINRKITK